MNIGDFIKAKRPSNSYYFRISEILELKLFIVSYLCYIDDSAGSVIKFEVEHLVTVSPNTFDSFDIITEQHMNHEIKLVESGNIL